MANDADQFWDRWGNYMRAGGIVAVAGTSALLGLNAYNTGSPLPSSDRALDEVTREVKTLSDLIHQHAADISRLNANVDEFTRLAKERGERTLALENAVRELSNRQIQILDRLLSIENARTRR